MANKCKGCGAELQTVNPEIIGYAVSETHQYCQRCFKMIHYDAHKENDFMADNSKVLEMLESVDGEYVWIMDIFDLDTSLNSSLAEFYKNKSCSIILNKCDLLPDKINYEKLGNYVLNRIKKLNINTKAIITRGVNNDFIENFDEYIASRTEKPLVMTGIANVGKSTVINDLLQDNVVTVNRYPATTINLNEITTDKYRIIDTVGLVPDDSVVLHLSSKQLKTVVPVKRVRPTIYQIRKDQSFSLGGIARIDIETTTKASIAIYASNLLPIGRNNLENADKYWTNSYGKELTPTLKDCKSFKNMNKRSFINKGKTDYFISGLGFVTVTATNATVSIITDPRISVSAREAMI